MWCHTTQLSRKVHVKRAPITSTFPISISWIWRDCVHFGNFIGSTMCPCASSIFPVAHRAYSFVPMILYYSVIFPISYPWRTMYWMPFVCCTLQLPLLCTRLFSCQWAFDVHCPNKLSHGVSARSCDVQCFVSLEQSVPKFVNEAGWFPSGCIIQTDA